MRKIALSSFAVALCVTAAFTPVAANAAITGSVTNVSPSGTTETPNTNITVGSEGTATATGSAYQLGISTSSYHARGQECSIYDSTIVVMAGHTTTYTQRVVCYMSGGLNPHTATGSLTARRQGLPYFEDVNTLSATFTVGP